jgi:predicted nucleic acid-binding Zn ribbon protein
MAKKCMNCDNPIQGRSDKKFCDDLCRSNFNHEHRKAHYQRVKEVNSILARNRKLLLLFAQQCADVLTIDIESLEAKGFNSKFFTHLRKQADGEIVYMCYDTGYVKEEDPGWVRIVPKKSSPF